jgi:eukaryotic-like serine/threonine-protein kinase
MNSSPEEALFQLALAKPADKRVALLDAMCECDSALRARLEALLAAHEQPAADDRSTALDEVKLTEGAGAVIGRYKLLEKLGEGGFGAVWAAEQREPVRRRVALKIIKLGMDTRQVVARFEAERQALALMDHPNIAKVLDAGTTDTGRPFFVMELVRGIPITKYCDHEKLGTKDRLDLFIKVCQAIQHAHQKGIIHRDIKPSNIMVTLHDGVPVPKVIDFGIAKATQQELTELTIYTQHHQFIGTPAYMSPEQAEMSGLDIDTRSDIYSLGVLLYELLTGKTPFDAKELMKSGVDEMRRIICEQEPVRPSTRLTQRQGDRNSKIQNPKSKIENDLDWIVMKCLEKDRTRRYDTANGLAMDIQRHLGNEPVIARPPSAAYRFQKAWRRNKLVCSAAVAVAVALLGGIAVSTWQAAEARRAQVEAELSRRAGEQLRLAAESAQKVAESEQVRADAQALKAFESQQQSRRLLYASDMNLAEQSLKLNNLGRALRLLDRHRPQNGEEDLRGWEWRYLWQLTRSSALVTLTNRTVRGFSVSFSPEGSRLAVGWHDGRVDLWDVPGRLLLRALTDHDQPYQGFVAFSPVSNLLAATSEPMVVTLYDLDSGRESVLWRAPDPGLWNVRDLSFSKDGSRLLISAGTQTGPNDAVWVVNVASKQIESRHSTGPSRNRHFGGAQLSPDLRHLYLAHSDGINERYSIQCVDSATGQQIWQTDPGRDRGVTALTLSPDGRWLTSCSGFEDPTVWVWEAATGRLVTRLDGHTGWVGQLVFTRDGRQMISAASDQTIRFWDTATWTVTKVLRGHTDEIHSVALSASGELLASAARDGSLMLWKADEKISSGGYVRLPRDITQEQLQTLDHSRVLLLPRGRAPELLDLKQEAVTASLSEIGGSSNVLGCFGTNLLCHWDGGSQIVVRELQGARFIPRRSIPLADRARPGGVAFNPVRQHLAWAEPSSPTSVYLTSLAEPSRRVELRSDVHGLIPFEFSADGKYLAARTGARDALRIWNVDTGESVASIAGSIKDAIFAAGGRRFVVATQLMDDNQIAFYDLTLPNSPPRLLPEKHVSCCLAVSPEGTLVASSTSGGVVRLLDPANGELIDSLHGHLNGAFGIAFSPDGRRLISASGGRDNVKVWDVQTRQELLTLSGTGSLLFGARWSADGNVIFAGVPWQAWRAPSWAEIAAAEAQEKVADKKP